MNNILNFYPVGDTGLKVELGAAITIKTNQRIKSLKHSLEKLDVKGIIDLVPGYTSLTIYFQPLITSMDEIKDIVIGLEVKMSKEQKEQSEVEIIHIPVCYGNKFGPDIGIVAKHNNITEGEVILLHTKNEYLIYMLGFLPGFPYLGGLSNQLHTPRLMEPRSTVARGSVGIADQQTGIYPLESPGGWNIIGRTPVQIYNPNRAQPFLFKTGQFIKFYPISYEEYINIELQVKNQEFSVQVERRTWDGSN